MRGQNTERIGPEELKDKIRRQDSRDENPGLMKWMEDSSLRRIVDFRLPIVDCRLPPLWRANTLLKVRTAQSSIANRQSTIANGR